MSENRKYINNKNPPHNEGDFSPIINSLEEAIIT